MRVGLNTTAPVMRSAASSSASKSGAKQASFGAVDAKFFNWAQDRGVTAEWLNHFGPSVTLFKTISKTDAVDTLSAVRRFVSKRSMPVFDQFAASINRFCSK